MHIGQEEGLMMENEGWERTDEGWERTDEGWERTDEGWERRKMSVLEKNALVRKVFNRLYADKGLEFNPNIPEHEAIAFRAAEEAYNLLKDYCVSSDRRNDDD